MMNGTIIKVYGFILLIFNIIFSENVFILYEMLFNILFVSWVIELNVLETDDRSVSQNSSSNTSLPTVPSEGSRGVGQVASWAVSFERLLEDPMGIRYFTVSKAPLFV